ncbi:hypothetical protein PORY_002444, partial [Pneumocystis oryctolagi]
TFKTQEKNTASLWSPSFPDMPPEFLKDFHFDGSKDKMLRISKSSVELASGEKDVPRISCSPVQSSVYKRERAETMPSGVLSNNELPYSDSTMTRDVSLDQDTFKMSIDPSVITDMSSMTTSRFRSGSLTLYDRNIYASTFGSSVIPPHWTQYLNSRNLLSSHVSSKDEDQTSIKTLDCLGLADASASLRLLESSLASCNSVSEEQEKMYITDINSFKKDLNRIRSYSVPSKEEHEKKCNSSVDADEDIELKDTSYSKSFEKVYQDSSNLLLRPRARTTGIINLSSNYEDNQILSSKSFITESPTLKNDPINNIVSFRDNTDLDEMGYGDVVSRPTRSLWIINLPLTASNSSLTALFSQFGTAESIWILADKKYCFVNYTRLESAIQAKSSLDGKELFSGNDPIRVEYIKTLKNPMNMYMLDTCSFRTTPVEFKSKCSFISVLSEKVGDLKSTVVEIATSYAATQEEVEKIWTNIQNIGKARCYAHDIPPAPDVSFNRQFYGLKLKEIRKKFDNGGYTQREVDEIANDMINDVSELSSDYLGNTIVQKLFEYCSEEMKEKLLKKIAPHLSGIGVHKNGTWAAQKIIDLAKTKTQINDIIEHLSPYIPLLFLDQFGNYVVQCCLKFQAPMNNFIIEIMADRCWEISQGRFGARAMRACLESNYVTKEQQRYLAVVITLESYRLATNPNSVILLTWLLDSSTFPNRFKMLAFQFVYHIVYLCTHKLASNIVLRIINQKLDLDAREILLNALFFSHNGQILNEVLSDGNCGVNTIFKIFTVAYLEDEVRQRISIALKQAFSQIKIVQGQQYKSLMNEIGLNHGSMDSVSKNMDFSRTHHMKTDKNQDHTLSYLEYKNSEIQEHLPLFSHPFSADYYKNLNMVNNNVYPLQYYSIPRQKMSLQHYDVPFIHQQYEIPHHSFPYISSLFNQQYMPNGYPCSLQLYPFNINTRQDQDIGYFEIIKMKLKNS